MTRGMPLVQPVPLNVANQMAMRVVLTACAAEANMHIGGFSFDRASTLALQDLLERKGILSGAIRQDPIPIRVKPFAKSQDIDNSDHQVDGFPRLLRKWND